MLTQLLQGGLLVLLTVAIHGSVLGRILSRLGRPPLATGSTVADSWLLGRIAIWCVLAHLAEISLWAVFYWWRGVMPDPEVAFYFSAVTYATIGYGDVTPPADWRLLASIEGLTGILMCAWSGGFFFAIVQRLQRGGDRPADD